MNTECTSDTAASGIVPANFPTMTVSAVCTIVCPSCETITGPAKANALQ